MRSVIRVTSVTVLSFLCGGCFLGPKRITASLPQPPQPALTKPAPVLSIPPGVAPIETPLPDAPVVVAKAEEPAPPAILPTPEEPKKPAPRRLRQTAAAPVPAAVVPENTPPPEPVPQLQELLTPERQAQYETELTASVERAKAVLKQVSHRKLDKPQRENVNRIQTFLTQAETAKKDDLGTALQLARRADLLGQDLLKSLLP
jgi:hypothetical protein